jgi:hypothetical protein
MTQNVSKSPGPWVDNRFPLATHEEWRGLPPGFGGQFENDAQSLEQSGSVVHDAWAGWYFMNEQVAEA